MTDGASQVERRSVDRSRLPDQGPTRPFAFPAIQKSALANGLGIWTVNHPQIPVVSIMLLVRRGSASDPAGREGLAAMTADMLDEGSGDRSAIEIHEALARLGAQFDTDIGSDATVLSTTVLTRFTDRLLDLMSDVVVRPALRESDFARVRQLRMHRLMQLRDVPSAVADRAFLKLLYGTHPYGHPPIGTEAALTEMDVDDVRAFHAAGVNPAASTLIAVGDCRHDDIHRFAESAFGGWGGAGSNGRGAMGSDPDERLAFEPGESVAAARSPRLAVVPRPGAPQSELRIGHVGVARDTPDYHPLLVANTILGGQFVSRINLNLREDKGFTYGARTAFEFRRMPGPFVLQAGVHTAATAQAVQESIRELADIRGARPVTEEERALGVAGLTRGYARNFETAEQIARGVMQLALYGLPDDYFASFVPAIEQVTCADVSRVMNRHLDPDRLITLIVGDLDAIGPGLIELALGDPAPLAIGSF